MTRAQWAVVLGLLAFILVIFGVLLVQLQVPSPPSTSSPPAFLLEEGAQARTVLPIAVQEALQWQSDAQLATAAVVWDDLGPGGVLKRDRWTFEFYSPSQMQMAVIRVANGQVERLHTARVPNPLTVLSPDLWQVSSTQALQTWWDRGGADFLGQHTHVAISLKLRMEPNGSRGLWIVAGSASDQHHVVLIDSSEGTAVQ
jgi:hypothetical protein